MSLKILLFKKFQEFKKNFKDKNNVMKELFIRITSNINNNHNSNNHNNNLKIIQ